jgi:hypothetical protein
MKNSVTITVLFEGPFWVAIFERQSMEGYAVARVVLGEEPTEVEFYYFLLNECQQLRYSQPTKEKPLAFKKKSPKRMQREARQLQRSGSNMSKAYESIRVELEKNKKIKKQKSRQERDEEDDRQFELKQQKKKDKKKGH